MSTDVLIPEAKRAAAVRRGRNLEYFTISYNSLEGLIAVAAGLMAGSIALVGFGFDSLIEVTSGAVFALAVAGGR
jgi:divalent metal cation (Fe/Co/Zn/Cd) transporter